jgi:adenylate kinase
VAGIYDPFAGIGLAVKAKLVVLGDFTLHSEEFFNRVRSLNLEHVSPLGLKRPEISRRAASAAAKEGDLLALMRRWFFSRKPDAGFVLTDFPATLLQAKVLDEWLDTRGEALSGIITAPSSDLLILQHYRTLGCPIGASTLALS